MPPAVEPGAGQHLDATARAIPARDGDGATREQQLVGLLRVFEALWLLTLNVLVPQALRLLTRDVRVLQTLRLVTLNVSVAQTLRLLTLDIRLGNCRIRHGRHQAERSAEEHRQFPIVALHLKPPSRVGFLFLEAETSMAQAQQCKPQTDTLGKSINPGRNQKA